jgi:D-aminoacyl-tRNA deacylase
MWLNPYSVKLILYSGDDIAGANIAKNIIDKYGFVKSGELLGQKAYAKGDMLISLVEGSVRDLTELPVAPEICVVASRHRSEAGQPSLTAHPTGNFAEAKFGGSSMALQQTNAMYLRKAILLLRRKKAELGLEYEVTREVTHHGPTSLPFPLLFVEVGSSEAQWSDQRPCSAVADVIYEILSVTSDVKPSLIGFGGPHYAPNFAPLEESYALGHIMPKHAADYITEEMVLEMIAKTTPAPEVAAIDWKGLRGEEKDRLTKILDKIGLRWVKTADLK